MANGKRRLTMRSFGRKLRCAPFAPHSLVVISDIQNHQQRDGEHEQS